MLENENKFFKKPQIFNLDELNGEIVLTEFDSIYSRTNAATLKTLLGLKEGVYQYEVQLGSNGSMHIGWATENCVFNDTILVGKYCFEVRKLSLRQKLNLSDIRLKLIHLHGVHLFLKFRGRRFWFKNVFLYFKVG